MRLIYLSVLLIGFSCIQNSVANMVVITNKPLSVHDMRYQYTDNLLRLALEATIEEYGPYSIEHADRVMTRNRTLRELIAGKTIHVMAEAPKPEWLQNLLVVRLPIRKGVQGYRLFLIKDKYQKVMEQIDSLDALKRLPTGSGQQWSTRAVMENAGFNVVTSNNYDSLFDMLANERFITFGRGINEVFREHAEYTKAIPDIHIDQHVALYIPLPTYFFISPKQQKIAQRISLGLSRLIENGKFDEFFYSYHCEDLLKAKLNQRKLFSIPNTNLPEDAPTHDEKLWLNPKDVATACEKTTQRQ